MNRTKQHILALSTLASLSLCTISYGTCSIDNGAGADYRGFFDQYTVHINPYGPVGETLATVAINDIYIRQPYTCTSIFSISTESTFLYLGNNLYNSNVPGIGFRVYRDDKVLPYTTPQLGNKATSSWSELKVELVKIGDIPNPGEVIPRSRVVAFDKVPEHNFNPVIVSAYNGFGLTVDFTPKPTCTVAAPDTTIPVDFEGVSLDDFNSEGRSPTVNFDIKINCSNGLSGAKRKIHVTLTDQTQPGNRSTQLSLAPGSTASGVVVEVRNKYGLVSFGRDTATLGNPGQWFEAELGNEDYKIPLSANYLKVSSNPTQGSANANATFTMSYE